MIKREGVPARRRRVWGLCHFQVVLNPYLGTLKQESAKLIENILGYFSGQLADKLSFANAPVHVSYLVGENHSR